MYLVSLFETILPMITEPRCQGLAVATVQHDRLMYERPGYLMASGIRERKLQVSTLYFRNTQLLTRFHDMNIAMLPHDDHGPGLEPSRTVSPKLNAFFYKLS